MPEHGEQYDWLDEIANTLRGTSTTVDDVKKWQVPRDVDLDQLRETLKKRAALWDTVIGKVVVVDEHGEVGTWSIYGADIEWWELVSSEYPPITPADSNIPVMVIPRKELPVDKTTPAFATCTFDSTRNFLKAIYGRELHVSDEEWLRRHPHAEAGGIPQEYTFSALAELVEPYGFKIARIRLRQGAFFMGDAIQQWVEALGCNPFATADRRTTNREAAEKMGVDLVEVNGLWRFEYGPDPLRPSVIGERSMVKTDHVSPKYGGHARYLPPRDAHGTWYYSIQFAPASEVPEYSAPITFPEYVAREDVLELKMNNVRARNGKWLADRVHNVNDPRLWKPGSGYGYSQYGGGYARNRPFPRRGASTKENGHGRTTGLGTPTSDQSTPHAALTVPYNTPDALLSAIRARWGKVAKKWHYMDLYHAVAQEFCEPTGDESLDTFICAICATRMGFDKERLDCSGVCETCYRDAWGNRYSCPSCKTNFGHEHSPVTLGKDGQLHRTVYQCPSLSCAKRFYVWWFTEKDPLLKAVSRCARFSDVSHSYDGGFRGI